jgi:dipeptidyl aminopeptidase/acylaminoacyl peptidase
VAVIGQSNGGCAVNLLVTTTDRFKAAVSADGMSDLFSFFGQLRVTPDGYPLGGWANVTRARGIPPGRGVGLLRDSAVHRLDRVTTPLLLAHGREDSVVGFEQAGEMFVGLNVLGKKVTPLAYHGESHVPSRFREANRIHMTNQVLAFLDHHVG